MSVLLETHFPGSKSLEDVRIQSEIMPVDNIFTVKRMKWAIKNLKAKSPGVDKMIPTLLQRAVDEYTSQPENNF